MRSLHSETSVDELDFVGIREGADPLVVTRTFVLYRVVVEGLHVVAHPLSLVVDFRSFVFSDELMIIRVGSLVAIPTHTPYPPFSKVTYTESLTFRISITAALMFSGSSFRGFLILVLLLS